MLRKQIKKFFFFIIIIIILGVHVKSWAPNAKFWNGYQFTSST